MDNLSEKTKEILKAVGVNDIEDLKGWSAKDIDFYLFWHLVDDENFTAWQIDTAAEEIAEALKQKEQ